MTGINKYDGKDRRRQRLRNHIAKDRRTPKYAQKVIPDGRTRKWMNTEDEVYYDERDDS